MGNKDINHPIWGYHISGNPYMRIYIIYLDIWKPWHKQFHTMCIAGCVYNISYCARNNVWKTSIPISHDPSSFSPFHWPVWGILSLRQIKYCIIADKYIYIYRWWLTYPSEKYESLSGWLFPYIMEKKCLKPPTSTIMLGTDHDCGRWEPRYIYISLSLSPVISIPQMILPGDGAITPDFWRCSSLVTQFDGQITGLGEQSLLTEEIVGLADEQNRSGMTSGTSDIQWPWISACYGCFNFQLRYSYLWLSMAIYGYWLLQLSTLWGNYIWHKSHLGSTCRWRSNKITAGVVVSSILTYPNTTPQHFWGMPVCPIFQSKFQTMCIFSASQGARSPIQTTPQNDRKCIWNCQIFHNEFHNAPHNHSEMSGTANQQFARLVQTTLRAGETPTQQENHRTTNVNGGWKDKISHQFLCAEPCFAHWFGPSVSTVDLPSRW